MLIFRTDYPYLAVELTVTVELDCIDGRKRGKETFDGRANIREGSSDLHYGGAPLHKKQLIIDFENIQQIDKSCIPEDIEVWVFAGEKQKCLPFELVQDLQPLGGRVNWLRIDGAGSNALDFHIAYHLGAVLSSTPGTECFILSKDSGFDPLVRSLQKAGRKVRRIASLLELAPITEKDDPNYVRMMEVLTRTQKRARPRRRATLIQHVAAMFAKKLTEPEVLGLIDRLFAEGKVMEANKQLTYGF
jgi:hypothetical protein